MREILFRGKSANPKEWCCGFYLILNNYSYIIPDDVKLTQDGIEMYHVESETVGQYTGFDDKNGNKIFEGDIVSICNSKTFSFIVYWNHAVKSFILKSTVNGGNGIDCNVLDSTQDIEVIGNIYDNPELLEGVINNG